MRVQSSTTAFLGSLLCTVCVDLRSRQCVFPASLCPEIDNSFLLCHCDNEFLSSVVSMEVSPGSPATQIFLMIIGFQIEYPYEDHLNI